MTLLQERMRRVEAAIIRNALRRANGSVTVAAKVLGLTHQALSAKISAKHPRLRELTPPRKKRRRSFGLWNKEAL